MEENKNNDIPKLEVKASTEKPSFLSGVGKYVIEEYIAPQANDMMHDILAKMGSGLNDAFQGALNKIFYHQDAGRRTGGSTGSTSYTSYYSRPQTSYNTTSRTTHDAIGSRSSTQVNIITVDTEEDAKRLCNFLQDLIRNYKVAKVSDLYSSLTPKVQVTFQDYKFGWTNPNDIRYKPIFSGPDRGKYQLDLPAPIEITNIQ